MTKGLRKLPLRTTLLLLIALAIVPYVSVVIFKTYHDAMEDLSILHKKKLKEDLSSLVVQTIWNYRKEDISEIQHLVSLAAAKEGQEQISLIDGQGYILASSRLRWVGKKAQDVLVDFNAAEFHYTLQKHLSRFTSDQAGQEDKTLQYYQYLQLGDTASQQDVMPAVFFGVYQYNQNYEKLLVKLQNRLIGMLLIISFFLFVAMLVLRHWITKPLEDIHQFVRQTSRGDWSGQMDMNYGGEMLELAQKLLHMRDQLRLSEKDMKEAYVLLESLIDSVPDLIFYKNHSDVYLGCNDAFSTFFGKKSQQDIIGLTDADFVDKEAAELFKEEDQIIFRSGEAKRKEEWLTSHDGKCVLFDTLKTPYYDNQGRVIGLIGVSRDITNYRNLEEQYLQAQKMEAIGTLVGGIAHDFNNMLAGIVGNTYLLKKKFVREEKALEKITNIENISARAADMIKQLMTFSRQGPMMMIGFSLRACLLDAMDIVRSSIPENIEFQSSVCDEELPIVGDETIVVQMLLNLASNARDALNYKEQPQIVITLNHFEADKTWLSQHEKLSAKTYAHIMVKDNGEGISDAHKDKIFEPFFTTKAVDKGTGLGLAMVYGAVEMHEGLILLDTVANAYTAFHIYLPLEPCEKSLVDRPVIKSVELGKGECVLVVDDESEVLETAVEVLESLGYRVFSASDGEQGLAFFEANQNEIDIVLTDVVMPKYGGVKMLQAIRLIAPQLPAIFMTGYDMQQVMDNIPNNSLNITVAKPIQFDDLNQNIRTLLDQQD